ncbi:hypothetical protein A2313_00705 [Candidatus Roizmanbacteria bacterium RIFOXYB2_FULL_41_10]|uniref:GIY-YIG domain-containing protein n=1 Tax=Candidatus Roizmanbacteria bacterium RIFOXYA1_FULL_41_12 TaxID=1802082 RepID=A0A1F7K954_9BACT|nr:MAG: hypothetical protein A2209_03690 [Candidatus Roizmanbacteria bacterium RIFOXYA1_FULL_41_12]OGK66973.1 MAG: hypothetical protein A2377_03830 [Candidatus Roizmanbacteria bacterium RIFOXYB1_FULL_41_27]OGK68846.1 MAG: hypothetical protein A2313_00705 [Candidatus Roizmanbacteria bacterium RIFOXYB2_FULL_41_10]OGK71992.1 MAG: hypothetical protein A2403_03495 [Candidatus Roizmanbacteria bacterium RIFOXYC1_FULL_41_16]OGK74389.1 MAG: hypothetical protein A2459_03920 [Candidatus Roizmanbacteria ba
MYYTYVLISLKNSSYYIGCTNNLKRRVSEHNAGLSKYTRIYSPWLLKYSEEYNTLKEARKREKEIKSWKKRAKIERLFALIV